VELGRYELLYTGLETDRQANLTEFGARLDIFREGKAENVGSILPRRNIYDKTPEQPTSEVGLHMSLVEDVYVVLNGWDEGGATATFSIFVNPLTVWMWIGGIILALGTLIAAWPHPARRKSDVRSVAYAVSAGA
jgi:cytochrome c-type biogenesis protein CcmF